MMLKDIQRIIDTLTVPAAEYVPAISDALTLLDELADKLRATPIPAASQSPGVPAGWEIDRTSADTIAVNLPGLGGYLASPNSENIASSILYHLAVSLTEHPPAAPGAERVDARDGERLADQIVREVSELGDRSSPEDWPEAMLVTADELRLIVVTAVKGE